MPATFVQKLNTVRHNPALLKSLAGLQRGIEKESLRIDETGLLSQKPHPQSLGSALCHPKITTDYSEALLEFITPVFASIDDCLQSLHDIHHFTYHQLQQQQELLWTCSMPCQLGKSEDIPLAQYGSSNVAKMKTIYRRGLGFRYGRIMQTISGIHYNFSLSDKFWANYQQQQKNTDALHQFKTEQYFGLIRNFRRYVPLLVYLFGASPALCRSFVKNAAHNLEALDEHSFYRPFATSLRMGDLGYQSSAQQALFVCYNSLENYIDSLRKAITVPHADYEAIGLKDADGEYQQLNTALLQIENEFYSTIRPKRVAASGEAPINALARGGVEYIEVRCMDVNPFSAVGIDSDAVHFLDLFLLFCLFNDSPQFEDWECEQNDINLKRVVNDGRNPVLTLTLNGEEKPFNEWGNSLLDAMLPLADVLDSLHATKSYRESLTLQREKMQNSSKTPSAIMLEELQQGKTFAQFGLQQSRHWQDYFLQQPMPTGLQRRFATMTADSLAQQATIEAADDTDFSTYLAKFYAQYY